MATLKNFFLLFTMLITVSINCIKQEDIKEADPKKINILVLWGDDIGWFNISAYNHGIMGYRTPHIDRLAREGALLTDCYSQQSCTAGRATFITGQSPIRTGLTKVGLPGAYVGIKKEDPTIAELLKPYGYACGHFGKNHLGDRNEMLPTEHGFDEFFGNLYHLNAEEEPEHPDYPKDPAFKKKFGPRGVIHSFANGKIEDTGPLTKKRMETIDDEVTDKALAFIERSAHNEKPFFLWFNSTRMHIWTHLKPESRGNTGFGLYADGMAEHDAHVGKLLDKLDELGITENTIVIYSTDNGAAIFNWPDGGTTPFREGKATNWEGGFRVPCLIRWPGVIQPNTVFNEIFSHEDWLPTFLAIAGEPAIKEKLLQGYTIGPITYKVHLDGYNLLPFLHGKTQETPRHYFMYWNDDGELTALRYNKWKIVFAEQRAFGMSAWQEPFSILRVPKLFDLRADPFERADESIEYARWRLEHTFVLVPAQAFVQKWLASFKQFPPRQKPASFSLKRVLEKVAESGEH